MANCFFWRGKDLFLQVYLQPRASLDAIVGRHGDYLKIRITAPPLEGRANQHLKKFLAKCFKVPLQNVTIEKGELGRVKFIRIHAPENIDCLNTLDD